MIELRKKGVIIMLNRAKKFFLIISLIYLVLAIIDFIIALPDALLAFGVFFDYMPSCLSSFITYLVLKDIDERISMLTVSMLNDFKPIKEQLKNQERQIKQLSAQIEQLKNKEN
jgi:hypothetical protein